MSKQKLETAFLKVQDEGHKAFVPYIMAGDGGIAQLEEQVLFLEKSGAAAIEVGVPFSDPVADGSTIQAAGKRALENGTTLTVILHELEKFKETRKIPIVMMMYINLIYAYGIDNFAQACEKAGVDGLIIPDLPLEEEILVTGALERHEIALIRLVSLTSPAARQQEIAARTEGFLYAVTVTGTTGARTSYHAEIGQYLQQLKQMTATPVLAGFGVSTPEQVRMLSDYCDGVVVGSKIVELLHQGECEQIKELIAATKKSNLPIL